MQKTFINTINIYTDFGEQCISFLGLPEFRTTLAFNSYISIEAYFCYYTKQIQLRRHSTNLTAL